MLVPLSYSYIAESLDRGIYRYLPIEHALVLEQTVDALPTRLSAATLGQAFIATAPVTFLWTVIPYRMEWRYQEAAHRVIAMDVGHLCQNLYLAATSIGAAFSASVFCVRPVRSTQ